MKFNELNTPFCKIPMLTYGCDGKKAVRHYVEVQPITNTCLLYTSDAADE